MSPRCRPVKSFECCWCKFTGTKKRRRMGDCGTSFHHTCLLHAQPSTRHNQPAETQPRGLSCCRSPSSRGERSRGNVQPFSSFPPPSPHKINPAAAFSHFAQQKASLTRRPPAHIGVSMATGRRSRFSKVRAHLEPSRTEAPLLLDIPLHTHTHPSPSPPSPPPAPALT